MLLTAIKHKGPIPFGVDPLQLFFCGRNWLQAVATGAAVATFPLFTAQSGCSFNFFRWQSKARIESGNLEPGYPMRAAIICAAAGNS